MATQMLDVPFRDKDSLKAWLLDHYVEHERFAYETVVTQGLSSPVMLPIQSQPDLAGWLMDHQAMHTSLDQILGIGSNPDLVDVDWNNESEFYDWQQLHDDIHELIKATLGIQGI